MEIIWWFFFRKINEGVGHSLDYDSEIWYIFVFSRAQKIPNF